MPRGGRRPGAGRPRKGSRPQGDIISAPYDPDMTPLQYMLSVLQNPQTDPARRDRMAAAAAPYVHARADDRIGKKADKAEKAKAANSAWLADLAERSTRPKQ